MPSAGAGRTSRPRWKPIRPHVRPCNPAQTAAQDEDTARLRQALHELPDDMREILLLRDYHDLSYAEIAGVLNIAAGTAMSRLHRARSALRQRMQGGGQP